MDNLIVVEGFPEAVRMLRRSLRILTALESETAAAAVAFKLVDCLGAIINREFSKALNDVWMCSFAVQRVLYNSLSEHLKKTSKIVDNIAADDYERGAKQYMLANAEITQGTGFEILFTEKQS